MSTSFQPRIGFVLGLSGVLGLSLLPTANYAALPIIEDEWGLSATGAGAVFAAYQAGLAGGRR